MINFDRALRQFDVGGFITKVGGQKESRSSHSHEYLMTCPKCGSERLRWNHQKDAWICWGCNRKGNTVALLQIVFGLDEQSALRYILDGYEGGDGQHASLDVQSIAPITRKRATLRRLPTIPWPPDVERLAYVHPHAQAWIYLHKRGVSQEQAAAWRLGFCRHGWLKGYLFFPVYMDDGLVYWQARAAFDPPGGERKGFKKTMNPKSVEGHATAGDVLLNYDRARTEQHVVVTEGPFDAIKVGTNAVAMLGKVPTPHKVARLLRMRAMRYTIYLDRGQEERRYAEQLASQLSAQAPVYIAEPPEGYDPGSLTPEQNAWVIQNATRYKAQLSERPLTH